MNITIHIDQLRVRPIVGVYEYEREAPQDLLISADITFDGTNVAKSDDVVDTLDYVRLGQRIITAIEATEYQLIESVLHHTLNVVCEDDRVLHAHVTIEKPGAGLRTIAKNVAVSGERFRDV